MELIRTIKGYTEIFPYAYNDTRPLLEKKWVFISRKGINTIILEEIGMKDLLALKDKLLQLKKISAHPILTIDWKNPKADLEPNMMPMSHKEIDKAVKEIDKVIETEGLEQQRK